MFNLLTRLLFPATVNVMPEHAPPRRYYYPEMVFPALDWDGTPGGTLQFRTVEFFPTWDEVQGKHL